jgi:hypothetical protein
MDKKPDANLAAPADAPVIEPATEPVTEPVAEPVTEPEPMSTGEVLGWLEFGCWMALVQIPIIWWLQGPSVSTDQFVVRTSLVVIAAAGGIALRTRALLSKTRSPAASAPAEPAAPGGST